MLALLLHLISAVFAAAFDENGNVKEIPPEPVYDLAECLRANNVSARIVAHLGTLDIYMRDDLDKNRNVYALLDDCAENVSCHASCGMGYHDMYEIHSERSPQELAEHNETFDDPVRPRVDVKFLENDPLEVERLETHMRETRIWLSNLSEHDSAASDEGTGDWRDVDSSEGSDEHSSDTQEASTVHSTAHIASPTLYPFLVANLGAGWGSRS